MQKKIENFKQELDKLQRVLPTKSEIVKLVNQLDELADKIAKNEEELTSGKSAEPNIIKGHIQDLIREREVILLEITLRIPEELLE